jgi:SRSO17 transposase
MTPEQIQNLVPAFSAFLQPFLWCCGYTQTFDLLGVYCRGLLSDLPRKSVEPIALAAGVAVRTLQEFLKDHVWNQGEVRTRLQEHVAQVLPTQRSDDLGTVGLVDECSMIKKGTHTPGVQRQWCGAAGKKENCIVTVHLGVTRGTYKTLVDADLFLPQSWDHDRERCRAAGIPDHVVYQPKWQLALRQLTRARANGIQPDWLTFDEDYGSKTGFLTQLDACSGMYYVGEVPKSFRCFATHPRGPRPPRGWAGRRADALVRHSPVFHQQAWVNVRLHRQTLGDQVWRVKAAQVWRSVDRTPSARTYWLIVAENEATGEVKYFVSNAPADTPLETLLRVGFRRWNVEHAFRVSKSEIGFHHYEGRNYVGLLRHLILCLLTLTFVAGETNRLRGEKSGGDVGAGVPGAEQPIRGVAGQPTRDVSVAIHVGCHSVSPAA